MPPPSPASDDTICTLCARMDRSQTSVHVGLPVQVTKDGPGDLDLESGVRVTLATSVPILVSLGLSVLDLRPDVRTDRRQTASSLDAPA